MTRGAAVVLAAVLTVLALALGACGAESPDMTPSAAAELEVAVADVRSAIEEGDMTRARELLAALRTTVVTFTTTGAVTGDRAVEINRAIAMLDAEVVEHTPSPTAPPSGG